jgi:hypothetical protein
MEETPIRAVEMVRAIRDAIYEETKDLSREELKEFFAREAAAMRQESQQSRTPATAMPSVTGPTGRENGAQG